MTAEEILAELRELEAEALRQRAAVIAWTGSEAKLGQLRQNSDAPNWPEYVAAFEALNVARQRHGT